MKKFDIFISYRRTNIDGLSIGTHLARTIKKELESRNFKVFFDYNECTDGDFRDRVLPAVKHSRVFLLILTESALNRCVNDGDWVRAEIVEAKKSSSKIIPISFDSSFHGWPENLPEELEFIKTIQISEISTKTLFEKSIDLLIENRFPRITRHIYRTKINKWLFASTLVLSIAIVSLLVHNYYREKLLFAGSGTVENYLLQKKVNIRKYPNALYVPLPTKSSWTLIDEERLLGRTGNKNKKRTYFPILFSAMKANEEDFISSPQHKEIFLDEVGRVGEIFLTNDSLQVLFYPKESFDISDDSSISFTKLANILEKESHNFNTRIFCTTLQSGTYAAYFEGLSRVGICLDSIKKETFINRTTSLKDYGDKFIILGSSIYQGAVQEPGFAYIEPHVALRYVKTLDGSFAYKPLYIYIMAYLSNGDKSEVTIPQSVMSFLRKVGHEPSSRRFGVGASLIFPIVCN